MAKKHDTRWIKLGMGTLSVAAIIGLTGVISEQAEMLEVETPPVDLYGSVDISTIGLQEDAGREGNLDGLDSAVRLGNPDDQPASFHARVPVFTSRPS